MKSRSPNGPRPGRFPVEVDTAYCGGAELNVGRLATTPTTAVLAELISNAEYWLSFDMARFEASLARSASPLRELGIGIALRYSEAIDGRLQTVDLQRFTADVLPALPPNLSTQLKHAIQTLERIVEARDKKDAWLAEGFESYVADAAVSVHALRASGSATITIDDQEVRGATKGITLGQPFTVSARDGRKTLEAPTIRSKSHAPILAKLDPDAKIRSIILMCAGSYSIQVPGRAAARLKLVAQ